MATLGTNVISLVDHAKRFDPDGSIAAIGELLEETNEALLDMHFKEGNLPTGERVTIRSGLPTPSFRLFNQGVSPTKSLTTQVDESCGMLEDWSEVDKDLAMLNGNTAEFRLSEAVSHLEGMNQKMAETLFYGDQATAPEEFTGFTPRFNDSSGPENAENIIDGGGTTASIQSSIWLVCWSPLSCYGIFPKGSQAGIFHEDLGLQTIETATGIGASNGRLRAYQDHWQWKMGLVVKDWRYVVRVANCETSSLLSNSGETSDVTANLIRATHRLPKGALRRGRCAFYVNRTMAEILDLQSRSITTGNPYVSAPSAFGAQTGHGNGAMAFQGAQVQSFRGIPIRTVDALTNTEEPVS